MYNPICPLLTLPTVVFYFGSRHWLVSLVSCVIIITNFIKFHIRKMNWHLISLSVSFITMQMIYYFIMQNRTMTNKCYCHERMMNVCLFISSCCRTESFSFKVFYFYSSIQRRNVYFKIPVRSYNSMFEVWWFMLYIQWGIKRRKWKHIRIWILRIVYNILIIFRTSKNIVQSE